MTESYENHDIVFAKRLSESNDLQQNQMICNERAKEYIRELNAERNRMDKKFPIAERLIEIGKIACFCIDFPTSLSSRLSFRRVKRKLFPLNTLMELCFPSVFSVH